jgi:hypothetical protein
MSQVWLPSGVSSGLSQALGLQRLPACSVRTHVDPQSRRSSIVRLELFWAVRSLLAIGRSWHLVDLADGRIAHWQSDRNSPAKSRDSVYGLCGLRGFRRHHVLWRRRHPPWSSQPALTSASAGQREVQWRDS